MLDQSDSGGVPSFLDRIIRFMIITPKLLLQAINFQGDEEMTEAPTAAPGVPAAPVPANAQPAQLPNRRAAAEFFAGSKRLSQALQGEGITCQDYDLKDDLQHDMSDIRRAQHMLMECQTRGIRYAHFAPPCNSFSVARFPKLRQGSKDTVQERC